MAVILPQLDQSKRPMRCTAYTQMFRNGTVEAVEGQRQRRPNAEYNGMEFALLEGFLIEGVGKYLQVLKVLGVTATVRAGLWSSSVTDT